MNALTVVAGRIRSAGASNPPAPGESAGSVHQAALERAFARTFAVVATVLMLDFWFQAASVSGQSRASMAADALLSLLLAVQAARALRRPPMLRDLYLLAAGTASLMLASRVLAVPGSPFAVQVAYVLGVPGAAAWAVWSRHLVVPVPLVLVIVSAGAWDPAGKLTLAAEQAVTALATVTLAGVAARLMRVAARDADEDAYRLSRRLASQDAALAAEEAERRMASAVHDDVLSVLRAIAARSTPLPANVLAAKAELAQAALARQLPADVQGFASLESGLRRQALRAAPELAVSLRIDGDLDVPAAAAEALSGAVGEALRNVAAYAGMREVSITAQGDGQAGVEVTVRDKGAGFDPAKVKPASTGLRNSIRGRVRDAGGTADIRSSPGLGTTVVLSWKPQAQAAEPADPLAWARRVAPGPGLVFLGFMAPIMLSSLVLLSLHWNDMRWQPAPIAVYLALLALAALCARHLSEVRMTRRAAVGLAAANTALAALGTLVIAPGTTDAFACWVAGDTGIIVAAIYFIRGPVAGLATLAADLAALLTGLMVAGRVMAEAWLAIVVSPVVGTGLAVGFLAAFRGLSRHTESQLAEYAEGLRQQARAEAMSRADSAALENARRLAGPLVDLVASGHEPDEGLRMLAALTNATLRDDLLAPGFVTASLADALRSARTAGIRITVDVPAHTETSLAQTARDLLTTALAGLEASDDITLQIHPPTGGYPALLLLHVRSARGGHVPLRRCASERGVLISDLGHHNLLLRHQPPEERAVQPAA